MVSPDNRGIVPKGDVKCDVGLRWQDVAKDVAEPGWRLRHLPDQNRTCLRVRAAIPWTDANGTPSRRIRFHFYSDEGVEPPHIHVRCADGECKFWLDPVALARNRSVPAHTVREMERLVYEHIDLLLEKYDEHHPSGNRSRGDESVD